jgi:hypothetical protein
MTYDGAMIRIFVNGVQASSTAQTGNPSVTANALRIGGNSVWGEYFAGLIDEVRVYNRALSAVEIQADMNTAVSGGGALVTAQAAGTSCTGASTPGVRVIGASAEHSPAHHLMAGCCCGAACPGPAGGSASTSQVTNAGVSCGGGFDAVGLWALPYGRPPREIGAA